MLAVGPPRGVSSEESILMSDMAERLALHEFTEKAYLDYSMYCLLYTSDAADDCSIV